MSEQARIYLSPPEMGGQERGYVEEAFASNWIAPAGPHLAAFEEDFCALTGLPRALAVSSGTAALHLALMVAGVGAGDVVLCSDLTFAASVNPVRYVGAEPVLIDAEEASWNLSPSLFAEAVETFVKEGKRPRAAIVVHLYGQCAEMEAITEICQREGITLIEDAAEALGATYEGYSAGSWGDWAAFSFNGNKILTTGGGGMLVAQEESTLNRARKLASQAREDVVHYEHREIGYNYRMSNVLAGIGRGQLKCLEARIQARRGRFAFYEELLGGVEGVHFMPEAPRGRATRWLSCLTIDPTKAGVTSEHVRLSLETENIESRPVWKPMSLQPCFAGCRVFGGAVGKQLFTEGLCLPSGAPDDEATRKRLQKALRKAFRLV